MLKIIKELLDTEKNLVFSERAKGNFVMRPTSILWCIFGFLYLLAPIDIIPEGLIEPRVCGFIDDIILLCFIGYVVYLDIGGELDGCKKLYNGKVSKKGKSDGKDRVRANNKSVCKSDNVSDTSANMYDSDSTKEDTTSPILDVDANTNVNCFDDFGIGDCEERDDDEVLFEEESSFKL